VLFTNTSPTLNNRVNILFGDFHVKTYKSYKESDMTFSPNGPGIRWQ
jgi:prepilin-type processing-associated H-X9-DG protein